MEVRVLMWYTRGSSGPSTQSTANTGPVLQTPDILNILWTWIHVKKMQKFDYFNCKINRCIQLLLLNYLRTFWVLFMNNRNSNEVYIYGFQIYIHIISQHVIIKNSNFCKMQIFWLLYFGIQRQSQRNRKDRVTLATKNHAMKVYRRCGDKTPYISDLGMRRTYVVSFTTWLTLSLGKEWLITTG